MAMQAYALLAAADGAIDAYKELTGEDWKAYGAPAEPQVEKKAATAEMGASRAEPPAGTERSPPLFPPVQTHALLKGALRCPSASPS